MRTRTWSPAAVLLLLFIALQFAACGSSPPARFYTLSSLAVPGEAGHSPPARTRRIVAIGPVALPEYLDHPAVTTRSGATTLTRSELDRWGGSLGDEVTRVLVENMGHLLAEGEYLVLPWLETGATDYRVQLNITRFEGVSEGPVVLNATWMLYGKQGRLLLASGEASISEPVPDSGYAALSDAMSRALGALSRRVATALRAVSYPAGR